MSTKSKSKAAAAAALKGSKEPLKASTRPSTPSTSSGNIILPSSFHSNGKFQPVDEADDNYGSSYDSTSNNGSCSGEAEDDKEKTATSPTHHSEPVAGSDNDKREKVRQKNEKKHQRQREKRAQELHERCKSFLMSRKLEVLSQKLVAMGFSSERARLALVLNEGRVEESVAWLFEEDDERRQQQATADVDGGNMKIDIADELARISELEVKFKCSRQVVERAVVACEGDLDKAAEILKAPKLPVTEKVLEADDTSGNDTNKKLGVSGGDVIGRTQLKGDGAPVSIQIQQKQAGGNASYSRAAVAGAPSQTFMAERALHGIQSLRIQQSGAEWTTIQDVIMPLEKRRVSASSSLPISYTTPPLSIPARPMRSETQFTMLDPETRLSSQPGMLREPVILMQRPQSISAKQNHTSLGVNVFASSPPASTTGWYPNGMSDIDVMRTMNASLRCSAPGLAYSGSRPQFQQNQFQPYVTTGPKESNGTARVGVGRGLMVPPSLNAPSSLGLFSNPTYGGSSESLSSIDWSTGGSLSHIDYSSIDWSLNTTPLRKDWIAETWPPTSMGFGSAARPSLGNRGNNMLDSASSGGYEWTSPFEGMDLFRDPRQFVSNYKMK